MGSHHPGSLLSLLRQGLTLGVEFGTQSVEALLWVAQTIEESVYVDGSFGRTTGGLAFRLDNPPLRVGAFEQLRVLVDGTPIPGSSVRIRTVPETDWRTADSVNRSSPWHLGPGDRTEFEIAGTFPPGNPMLTVRIELRTEAIPPLVWFEFHERLGDGSPGP